MSQYLDFYIKSKNGEYLPIASVSRNTVMYQVAEHYAQFEKGRPINPDWIDEIIEGIDDQLAQFSPAATRLRDRKDAICAMSNSVEEKLVALAGVENDLCELEESVKEWEAAKQFYHMLGEILDTADDTQWSLNPAAQYNPNLYIYFGIEWNPYIIEKPSETLTDR